MSETNPLLEGAPRAPRPPTAPTPLSAPQGPDRPQPHVPVPAGPRIHRRTVNWTVPLWWMGVHGGAGESTLAELSRYGYGAGHAWPVTPTPPTVVLVARTHYYGLMRARHAATEWARGDIAADLLGLVLIADAPGALPRPLRDLARLVSGGVPRTWRIPWVPQWRLQTPTLATAPRAIHRLFAETVPSAAPPTP